MTIHPERSPFAGRIMAQYRGTVLSPLPIIIEDWYDRVHGKSWTDSNSPAVTHYVMRVDALYLPVDDEVLYVKLADPADNRGFLVHVDEIVEYKDPGRIIQ